MLKQYIKNLFIILFGCILMAIGTSLFLLPNKLSSGGFAGIATIVYYLFNVPLGIVMIIINVPVIVLTYYRLGKVVVVNSIIGSILYSVLIDLFDKLQPLTNDGFLASLYGGILLGLGTGIILNANATTGGTELVTNIIKTYNPNYRISSMIIIIDSIIVLLNVILLGEIEIGLYSAIAIMIMGKVIDIIVEGTIFSKLIFIISDENDKIAKEIGEYLKRGSTGIYGKGMFENKERMILMCATNRSDVIKIKQIVQSKDENAFIIISNAREVLGKGFK